MAYKDKDKQREAQRDWVRQKRAAKGSTDEGSTQGITAKTIVETRKEIELRTPLTNKPERTAQGNIRVSKPGDADYEPQCETTRAFIENRPKRPETFKRGKDIKCFEDLPPDVQAAINRISESNEEKQKRTAAAIKYQHLFPDQYHGTQLGRTHPPGAVIYIDGPPPIGQPLEKAKTGITAQE